ncbi:urea transporter [Scytonema sp. UIC 10036]|uniref:urea transporter n=1 Tax=Scytonema sp. UIC 10036 TaxID=2304196 RepID=UPI0012DA2D5D|nr:urea transporter [Scytonema sp. UIC 10036]MUG91077.1 urea transporter [Scytonema sp. UIC 10036]
MNNNHTPTIEGGEPLPLHELIHHILESKTTATERLFYGIPVLGTMQLLNQRLANQPGLNFFNATLRGIGQAIFVNNPMSGLLIIIAMFIQSPWLGIMSLIGTSSATLTAIALKLNPSAIQNGIFGLNGLFVGATLAFFGLFGGKGVWNPSWIIAAIVLSALSTIVLQTVGTWFATRFRVAPLGIAFHVVLYTFLLLIAIVPQPFFHLGSPPPLPSPVSLDFWRVAQSLPVSLGQVFFVDNLISILLVFLAVFIATPIGAMVGLLGCVMYLLAGLLVGARPAQLYSGFLGYNAVFTAMAIGGIFYAPNTLSISLGAACAFLASIASLLLVPVFSVVRLPILALPFAVVTIACLLIVQRALPSLFPVSLYTVATPEEHRQRFLVARDIITRFRKQLTAAIKGERHNVLFEQASPEIKGNLRYIFDAIDRDRNGELSTHELAAHLQSAGKGFQEGELTYLFKSIDRDGSGEIDFEEFSELMLRHRRLMSRYTEFVTYFLPLDADEDEFISTKEMNTALASVGEPPLSNDEIAFLRERTGGEPLTWNRFIEVLLVT